MLALLGLLAFAGYQNRDKISEMLKKAGAGSADPNRPPGSAPSGLEGVLAGLGDMIGGKGGNGGNSGTLSGGLGDLVDRFKQTGQAETADSWVKPGPNRGLTPEQVEEAVGAENIDELSARTGLPRKELLDRLATRIPEGVDQLTPEGRMPSEDQVRGVMGLLPGA